MSRPKKLPILTPKKKEPPPKARKVAWSLAEVVQATSLSLSTVYKCMDAGELKFIKVRGRRLILDPDLDSFLSSCRPGPEAA